MGQGLHTKMIQVASKALGVEYEKIHLTETATDKVILEFIVTEFTKLIFCSLVTKSVVVMFFNCNSNINHIFFLFNC